METARRVKPIRMSVVLPAGSTRSGDIVQAGARMRPANTGQDTMEEAPPKDPMEAGFFQHRSLHAHEVIEEFGIHTAAR